MSGAVFAVILAAALTGGGAAYLLWALVVPLLHRAPRQGASAAMPAAAAPAQPPQPSAPPEAPPPLPDVPMFPDPSLNAQIAAVRTDMAALARAQIALLEGMAERENQLLNEMRAVASVRDPELLRSLQRIEARLSGRPPPDDDATVLDDDEHGQPPGDDDAPLTIGRA